MLTSDAKELLILGFLFISNAFLLCTLWYHGPFKRIPTCEDIKLLDVQKVPPLEAYLVKPTFTPGLLPNLSQISWPAPYVAPSPNPNVIYRSKFFSPRMSITQRGMMFKYIDLFASIMRKVNLEDKWFISSGTLLGSLRHHDFIPWDDEADVLVDIKYRQIVQEGIKERLKDGYLVASSGYRDKLYMTILPEDMNDVDAEGSRRILMKNYGWPYLDICYYKIEDGHLIELENYNLQHFAYPVGDIFPLIYRPFGDKWLPAPYRSVKMLVGMYPLNIDCIFNGYSHLAEWRRRHAIASCGALANRYAFVRRCPVQIPSAGGEQGELAFVVEQMVTRTENGTYTIVHEIPTLVHFTERFSHFDPLAVNGSSV